MIDLLDNIILYFADIENFRMLFYFKNIPLLCYDHMQL